MHLIIDIRTHLLEEANIIRYALHWWTLWKERNPQDTITYLILEDQIAPEGVRVFRAKKSTLFSPRRRLTLENSNEILRCVNFSRYAPYDPSIPTLTHIFDMGQWLYDNTTNAHILRRKEREYTIRKLLSQSSHIIVPDFPTGSELVELWNVREDAIDILPFLDMVPIEPHTQELEMLQIHPPYFIHDGWYGNESNIGSLLEGFANYIHAKKGKALLVLHGNTGNILTALTDQIKELNIVEHVKITGILDPHVQEALYENALGWIDLSSYATHKIQLALALTKNLNLLLSRIPQYQTYSHAIKIHPNHLYEVAQALEVLEHKESVIGYPWKVDTDTIMQLYKKLLMQGKEKIIA